jgi:hypothetical protein
MYEYMNMQLAPVFQVLEKALGIRYERKASHQASASGSTSPGGYHAVSISEQLDISDFDPHDADEMDYGSDVGAEGSGDEDAGAGVGTVGITSQHSGGARHRPRSRQSGLWVRPSIRRLKDIIAVSKERLEAAPSNSCTGGEMGPIVQAFVLRVCVVVTFAVIATIARDFFSFIGAVVGSTGGVTMSYILPALFDTQLRAKTIGW